MFYYSKYTLPAVSVYPPANLNIIETKKHKIPRNKVGLNTLLPFLGNLL